MFIFLLLPGIVWDNLSISGAWNKANDILGSQVGRFLDGYTTTYLLGFILALPLVVFYILVRSDVPLPHYAWYLFSLYGTCASCYLIYLEEMYAASLYLWYGEWTAIQAKALANGAAASMVSAADIPPPTLFF